MTERRVVVVLEAPDGTTASADGLLREFTLAERARRAALVMLVAIGLAATLIPIPIIHLLGIPLLLIAGVVLTIRQVSSVARLRPLRIPCPKCGGVNRVGGGLGYRSITDPMDRMCEGCRRILTLRITTP
jgi:hypothetical protein